MLDRSADGFRIDPRAESSFPCGEFDLHQSPEVKEKLNPLIDELPHILVDFTEISYIDSSASRF